VLDIPISLEDKSLDDFYFYDGLKGPYYQAIVAVYLTWKNDSLVARVTFKNHTIYGKGDE
jgi:hypothetical protein